MRRPGRGSGIAARSLLAALLGLWTHAASALTIAVADSVYAAPMLVAEAEGYFAAEGLPARIVRCALGKICLQWLLDGEAQVATVADTPITVASFARRDFAIVATMSTSGGEYRMVGRRDRGVAKPADLKGRRVGTLLGTSAQYFTDTFLLYAGVASPDVTLVPLDPSDPLGALVSGDVAAAGLFDPHGRDALQQLGTAAIALPGPRFFTSTFNIVSVPAARGAGDDDLVKLLRAVRRGVDLIRSNPQRASAIVGAAMRKDPSTVLAAWRDFTFRLELAQPLITTLEGQARWALREKLVPPGSSMPDYLDFIRTGPLQRVAPQAVRLPH